MSSTQETSIIGAGLAGCEAAYQLLKRGCAVRLYEMRPGTMTPAHKGEGFAELVCSNSLRANDTANAVGLLKEEMRRLDSLIIKAADATAIPAGGALAVDRNGFSARVEQELAAFPHLTVVREEVRELGGGRECIIAAGPLASPALSAAIADRTGAEQLYFHDAIAPIIAAGGIDMNKAFFASRYGKGGGDYLNCPFSAGEYQHFYQELIQAELHPLRDFEAEKPFSGCMAIESIARSGIDSMRFGPLKPVGLPLPDGKDAYAVVQLRREDLSGNMYNLVGFQTRLKRGEQERVFRLIPGLERAEFLRFGAMHRNTYINAPRLLDAELRLKSAPHIRFAGQITGVEGYVESAASGLLAGIFAAAGLLGKEAPCFPVETALGSLLAFAQRNQADYQPMNINFGLLPPLTARYRDKKEKNAAIARRALTALESMRGQLP